MQKHMMVEVYNQIKSTIKKKSNPTLIVPFF